MKYISRHETLFITVWVVLLINMFSCTKDENTLVTPTIAFTADSVSISHDTAVELGTAMVFKITASSKDVPVTNLVVSLDNGIRQVYLDSGLYSNSFIYTLKVIKGAAENEKWTFFVMNKDRKTDSVSINVGLKAGAQFGNIKEYHIVLGAQNNADTGSFFSFTTGQIYNLEQAYNAQNVIDIDFYYHIDYFCTISSPNDNDMPTYFTGTYGISNWQTRNESRYIQTNITPAIFDQITNDSLLIVSYDVINAKRKAKDVQPGNVWSFRIASGKLGLIKVNSTVTGESGSANITIKIQE